MKQKIFPGLLLASLLCLPVRADLITWTNTAQGVWSAAANWSPNEVPGPADTAIIPIAGTNGVLLDITTTVQNLILDGGNLGNTLQSTDTLTVNGQLNWTNGILGCIVTNNGVMTLAGTNGVDYTLANALYNAGTFRLLSGNLQVNFCDSDSGELVNLAGAILDLQSDAAIDVSSNQFGICNPPFFNTGIIRKSGGTGTSFIYAPLNNTGTVDAQSGTISFNGGGDLNGTLQSEGAGSLILAANIYNDNAPYALDGNLTSTNAYLQGANLNGNGTISGALTWVTGSLAGALNVGTNGILILNGTPVVDYVLSGLLTNAGTIQLVSGNLLIDYCGSDFGRLYNLPGALLDIKNNISIDSMCGATLINQGIVRKSGGTATSFIGVNFDNSSGTLDAQSGTINLNNSYSLGGGTLSMSIGSATNYGQINLAGNAALSGTLKINLGGAYTPTNGTEFTFMNYDSETGTFSTLSLPSWINWQTNYGATIFDLTVQNNQPILAASPIINPGQFMLRFTGNPNAGYSVLATTNLDIPLAGWTNLGPASFISNSLFQYIDSQTTNFSRRFYSLRSP